MYMKKVYGESKIDSCPFCGKRATVKTEQGVPCCVDHRKAEMPNMKCLCKGYLDVCEGKWGAYFRCMSCGNMNFNKGLEINNLIMGSVPISNAKELEQAKKEPTVIYERSDEWL